MDFKSYGQCSTQLPGQRESSCSNTSQLINGATGSLLTCRPYIIHYYPCATHVRTCPQWSEVRLERLKPAGTRAWCRLWLHDSACSELNGLTVIQCLKDAPISPVQASFRLLMMVFQFLQRTTVITAHICSFEYAPTRYYKIALHLPNVS